MIVSIQAVFQFSTEENISTSSTEKKGFNCVRPIRSFSTEFDPKFFRTTGSKRELCVGQMEHVSTEKLVLKLQIGFAR